MATRNAEHEKNYGQYRVVPKWSGIPCRRLSACSCGSYSVVPSSSSIDNIRCCCRSAEIEHSDWLMSGNHKLLLFICTSCTNIVVNEDTKPYIMLI